MVEGSAVWGPAMGTLVRLTTTKGETLAMPARRR